jgi:hypothetical protein
MWMKIRQAFTEDEEIQPPKPIHLLLGTRAYHSMTPVHECALSKNYSDVYYSRLMWVK